MSRFAILVGCVLLSAVGWWAGALPGLLWSGLVVSALAYARQTARGHSPDGALASMPTWQLVLVPLLAAPLGMGLGIMAFILGPGF